MPKENTRQSYSPGYFNLYIFGKQTGRQKMLHQMLADVSRVQSFLNFFMYLILIFWGEVSKYLKFTTLADYLLPVFML
jgi:hypothetical protein